MSPRCEAGAHYVNGRLRYECPNEARLQVATPDGLDLLAVYCEEHRDCAATLVEISGCRLEPLR